MVKNLEYEWVRKDRIFSSDTDAAHMNYCMFCDERATEHYENLAGMMVFVCDDCYEDMVE